MKHACNLALKEEIKFQYSDSSAKNNCCFFLSEIYYIFVITIKILIAPFPRLFFLNVAFICYF